LRDKVEAVLVFGVQHAVLWVGFEGRQTGVFR
jgi:CII-binding regulator of phage lambda lysogenization HflD